MSDIRGLEREDLPEVASLYEHVARSGSRTAPPGLAAYFADTFLDHPWADPEIPSLVYVGDDGRIAGFIGSSVRRLVFDDRPVRMAICGQLVTEPELRKRAPGIFLLRKYLRGPQDLTVTDTASDTVQRIWEGLGGETEHLACVGWLRVFKPAAFASAFRSRDEPAGRRRRTRPLLSALDAVGTRVARRALRVEPGDTRSEPLTPRAVADHLDAVTGTFRLRPAYEDETFVSWLLGALAEVRSRGDLVARLVRARGRVRGWYVYYVSPGAIAQVLHVAGATERDVGNVLDDLMRDAAERGAAALQGRAEAHLLEPLARRRCVFHAAGYLVLMHSRDPEFTYAVQSGRALLTRMEGEWWMGHHTESFGAQANGRPP